jgi:hypothetical protein
MFEVDQLFDNQCKQATANNVRITQDEPYNNHRFLEHSITHTTMFKVTSVEQTKGS